MDQIERRAFMKGAGLGALDGRHPLLPHAHPPGDLRLGQPEPDPLLRQRPGAVRCGEGGCAGAELVRAAGEELHRGRGGS